MIAALTFAKKGMEDTREPMEDLGRRAQSLKAWFVHAVDRDTEAFNQVLAATRLPRQTQSEIVARAEALELASQHATRVPLEVLERTVEALEMALSVARDGNPSAVTDAGMAGACALAAAEGAALNVRINLGSLTDEVWAGNAATAAEGFLERSRALAEAIRVTVDSALDA